MPIPWNKFNKVLANFSEENFKEELVWHKKLSGLSRYGEGDSFKTQAYTVFCLVDWNFYRRWPINKPDADGLQDEQHCSVYIHKKELERVGLLTPNGNAELDPGLDTFEINGVKYLPAGDTEVAQSLATPQFFLLILRRAPVLSGQESRP